MERKKFLKNSFFGITTVLTGAALSGDNKNGNNGGGDDCNVSPRETKGPFPTKTPSEMVKSNITSDRKGIALLINLTVLDKTNNCKPLAGAAIDIWHCDKDGNYSEYGDHPMQTKKVYSSPLYLSRGQADTPNDDDNVFAGSLSEQMGIVTGNLTDKFTLSRTIVVRS